MSKRRKNIRTWWKNLSSGLEAMRSLVFADSHIEPWPDKKTELKAWQFNRKKFTAEIEQSRNDCASMLENRWLYDLSYIFNDHIKCLKESIKEEKQKIIEVS